ncbi:MAG TPA: aminotransferase class V-fold PLP-dependent enzyme [Stellaceae bacterium]|nr:aminotransferase class V-fold PLP-dependent enzyme [Stellaceae bacterium]
MSARQPGANDRPVYLDYQATTPTDPRVLAAMLPYFTEKFGNPHSASHRFGHEAEAAVERARAQVAALIGAEPREIVFTSGATESNNLAIKGAARFLRAHSRDAAPRDRIVTLATEHKCVLEAAARLAEEGFALDCLPVERSGLVDLERLAAAIGPRTALVSVMAANNEIGVIQPLAAIGALCRERGALFHTDAAQAAGKIPLDVAAMGIDLLSISGHKIYGPKGIGALYVRRRPRVRLMPLIDGGGQERGFRSGTLPTPLCVGLGEACALAAAEMAAEAARLLALRRRLLDAVTRRLPETQLNGDAERRLPGNLNLAFPGIDAEALLARCPAVAASTGSACSSASIEPSYVLRALGLDAAMAAASVRIGLGRFTTEAEVDFAADALVAAIGDLKGR